MILAKCISEIKSEQNQTIINKKYWIDDNTVQKDVHGDRHADIYLDKNKEYFFGNMNLNHFQIVYNYLEYGSSLVTYINTNQGFMLKDIIKWCCNNSNYQLAGKLIMYIHENHLDIDENLEKEFVVKSEPYKSFKERKMIDEYMKYLGYSLHCIDD